MSTKCFPPLRREQCTFCCWDATCINDSFRASSIAQGGKSAEIEQGCGIANITYIIHYMVHTHPTISCHSDLPLLNMFALPDRQLHVGSTRSVFPGHGRIMRRMIRRT